MRGIRTQVRGIGTNIDTRVGPGEAATISPAGPQTRMPVTARIAAAGGVPCQAASTRSRLACAPVRHLAIGLLQPVAWTRWT